MARWKGALKRLPAYPATGGDTPVVVDVQDASPIIYNITVPAVPVFSGDVVTWFSPPAERELFTRTVEQIRWNGNNAIYMMGVSRARLGMPVTREWLSDEIKARMRPNQMLQWLLMPSRIPRPQACDVSVRRIIFGIFMMYSA